MIVNKGDMIIDMYDGWNNKKVYVSMIRYF